MKEVKITIPDDCIFNNKTMSVEKIKPLQQYEEYVDLGLPSGTLWATCNIGAKRPEEFGNYLDYNQAQKYQCPSEAQFIEVIKYCNWFYCSKNNIPGYLVIGKNGNSIFLPAAGYRSGASSDFVGEFGYYWSSTLTSSGSSGARYLFFDSSYYSMSYGSRSYGRSVRPVKVQ